MKHFDKSKQDFEKVLKLDPENTDAKKQLDLCIRTMKSSLSEEKILAKNMMSGIGKGGVGDIYNLAVFYSPALKKWGYTGFGLSVIP